LISFVYLSFNRDVNKELTEKQKSAIITDITSTFEIAGEGITELNAEKAFSALNKKEGTNYIRDGHLYPDIETKKTVYRMV